MNIYMVKDGVGGISVSTEGQVKEAEKKGYKVLELKKVVKESKKEKKARLAKVALSEKVEEPKQVENVDDLIKELESES